ncbi:hypothetical protein Plec18167_008099 [Paecilomyces lecythidis]|uniref:Uncharacterized protein n=1 Tax=Paecilomyces lecythidis TaxID=3004212 RepID=A0ABR3WYM9_9EURO
MTSTGSVHVRTRVIYHGVSDNNNAATGDEGSPPITFHTYAVGLVGDEFHVYHRRCPDQSRPEADEWETFVGNDFCQVGMWDNPDRLINVSENLGGRFQTLLPGESWSNSWTMEADGYLLPDDLKPGERLRYQFKGSTLDWWDWGTAADHTQTIVTLPGSGLEPISDPKDNGGRPKVVVPASNIAEWTVVDE